MRSARRARLTLTMVGEKPHDDALRLQDFIQQLDSVRKALKETCRIRLPEVAERVGFRVTELSRSTPTTVVLEPDGEVDVVEVGEKAFDAFLDDAEEIEQGRRPRGYDGKALAAFQEMGKKLGFQVSRMEVTANGRTLPFSGRLHQSVGLLLGPKQHAYGSVTGKLERINVHRGQNIFTIYPIAGKTQGIPCHFGAALRDKATSAVDKYVDVTGKLTYNLIDPHPEEIIVEDMHVYPKMEKPPKVADLRGIAPEGTGDNTAEEFVQELRDET